MIWVSLLSLSVLAFAQGKRTQQQHRLIELQLGWSCDPLLRFSFLLSDVSQFG